MSAGVEKPTLAAVAAALAGLSTSHVETRREHMDRLNDWADKVGLPAGAGRLLLEHATRPFAPMDAYPDTPNEQLLRLLWNGKTDVACEDVEAAFVHLDDGCRASVIRLMAELGTRTASESLARILTLCATTGVPRARWPFLLPLERQPRDEDVLVPAFLGLAGLLESAGPIPSVLLAYAKAGRLTSEQGRECARIIASLASRTIADLESRLAARGLAGRWDDEYNSVKIDTGLLLDLLGQWCGPRERAVCGAVLERAVSQPEPWARLWGALGLIRGGNAVSPDVLREIAAWPECRLTLARQLESLERPELFPQEFMNQASLAEAVMVDWLEYPTELGRAPDEMRQLDIVTLNRDEGVADLYVFAFKTRPPHWLAEKEWVVGIAGPFLRSDQPTVTSLGATVSHFESLTDKSLREHIEALLETVHGGG